MHDWSYRPVSCEMPAFVKTPEDERLWSKAKGRAREEGQSEDWAYITQMKGGEIAVELRRITANVVARWFMAKGPLWQQFLDEVYEGGQMQVRNTNRDTKDRYEKVEALTLLKTDSKFRKLLRAQFEKWKDRREKVGLPGEAVTDLAELEAGQTLEWQRGKDLIRGKVQRTKPDRAFLQLEDGSTVHMRPWDVESWNPRIV